MTDRKKGCSGPPASKKATSGTQPKSNADITASKTSKKASSGSSRSGSASSSKPGSSKATSTNNPATSTTTSVALAAKNKDARGAEKPAAKPAAKSAAGKKKASVSKARNEAERIKTVPRDQKEEIVSKACSSNQLDVDVSFEMDVSLGAVDERRDKELEDDAAIEPQAYFSCRHDDEEP